MILCLFALGLGSSLSAASNDEERCCPVPQARCYQEGCDCYYCVGPDMVNPPVRPKTCEGDFAITIAGLYWISHQDGMEFAVENEVFVDWNPMLEEIEVLNTLVDADYKTPNFKWDYGYKLGASYAGCHDGWDIGLLWTHFEGKSEGHVEAEKNDNSALIALWSSYSPPQGSVLYARDIRENWNLDLNLIDIELGREFWTSKYLTLRPFMSLRIAYIDQNFVLEHKGGSWSINDNALQDIPLSNHVRLENDYKGVGLRAGLDSVWHIGCGCGIYGNLAASIIYGRFSVDHQERLRGTEKPFAKMRILEAEEHFRASRGILDLALGVQFNRVFCDCCYTFTARLGWEQHLFFHQNQLWRVVRVGDEFNPDSPFITGENVFHHRRGNLDTGGLTLTFKFEF